MSKEEKLKKLKKEVEDDMKLLSEYYLINGGVRREDYDNLKRKNHNDRRREDSKT